MILAKSRWQVSKRVKVPELLAFLGIPFCRRQGFWLHNEGELEGLYYEM